MNRGTANGSRDCRNDHFSLLKFLFTQKNAQPMAFESTVDECGKSTLGVRTPVVYENLVRRCWLWHLPHLYIRVGFRRSKSLRNIFVKGASYIPDSSKSISSTSTTTARLFAVVHDMHTFATLHNEVYGEYEQRLR